MASIDNNQTATRTTRSRRKPEHTPAPQENEFGRLQPQAVDLERSILGALLLEKEAFNEVCDVLKAESFYEHRHQLIFQAIVDLQKDNRPIDILTVKEKLSNTKELEEAGGELYLIDLTQKVLTSAHINYHARLVAQKHLARQLITFSSRVATNAFDTSKDVADTMQEAETILFELAQQGMSKAYRHIKPVVQEAYDQLRQAAVSGTGMTGLASGFTDLDKITAGWQKGDLIIIAARPAMGKTAFVLSMAKNIAVDNGEPVAIFSLEMPDIQLTNRLLSNVSQIAGDKIRSATLDTDDFARWDRNADRLANAPIYIDDTSSPSIFDLRSKARRLVAEHHVKVIIIDYLQLMNAGKANGFGNRQEEVSQISRSLKGLAKELNIPIIALSQLNRGADTEAKEGKRPQLSNLRESGAIEQDADIVCFIHRPEYYKIYQDTNGRDTRGIAEIIIAKHRNGSIGDVRLHFEAKYTQFNNLGDEAPMHSTAMFPGTPAVSDNGQDSGYTPDFPAPIADDYYETYI